MIRKTEVPRMLCGISPPFGGLSPISGQVTHVLLTRLPLYSPPEGSFLVRLACVRHAASVRSEPGSNSPVKVGIRQLSPPVHYQTEVGSIPFARNHPSCCRHNSPRKTGTYLFRFQRTSYGQLKPALSLGPCESERIIADREARARGLRTSCSHRHEDPLNPL